MVNNTNNDSSTEQSAPTAWVRYDPSAIRLPWHADPVLPGCEDWEDEYEWQRAAYDGAELYLAPDIPEIRKRNIAARQTWKSHQEARRRESARIRASMSPGSRAKRALGLVEWRCSTGPSCNGVPPLALLGRDSHMRDDQTNRALRYLAPLVNDGDIDREDLRDAILDASRRNGHLPDNKSETQIERDIDRAISKFTEPFDWTRLDQDGYSMKMSTVTTDGGSAGERSDDETSDTTTEYGEEQAPVFAKRLLTRSDLRNLPDPEPLIDNVLDQGTTALLYGKWSTGKTFIALDWAACVATGKRWQNRETRKRRVLYVVGEGTNGFDQRAQAWETGWHNVIDDDSLSIYPRPINLLNASDVDNLRALIEWGGYSFVIFDTLARCMVGAEENSSKDGGIVVDNMTNLLASTPGGRGVILGVHHAGKDGKTMRGTTAIESGVDTIYFTSRDEGDISLTREKRKDGPEHDHHLLKIDPIPGTGSAVMSAHHAGAELETERGATLLSIFVQNFETTGASKSDLRAIATAGGMSNGTFNRALSDLVKTGKLTNAGTVKRAFYVIGDQL